MEKVIFDIKKVEVKDLDGNAILVQLGKTLGNYLYATTSTIDWLGISQAIHKEEYAEMSIEELRYLRQTINSDFCKIIVMCKVAITQYIDKLIIDSDKP